MTLMEAYYRCSRSAQENRVTEVFATVLDHIPAYVGLLAARVGLEPSARHAIETQVRFQGSHSIDLEIQAIDDDGGWILWSEHKVTDPLTVRQIEEEAEALQIKAGARSSRLIAITLYGPSQAVRVRADSLGVVLLSWREIVSLGRRAGPVLGGSTWRVAAGSKSALLAPRMLLEWETFCEAELEQTRVDPLTAERIDILPEADQAWETVSHLLRYGFAGACDAIDAGSARPRDDELEATAPEECWLDDMGFKLYARCDFHADDSWTLSPTGGPVLVVGAWAQDEDAHAVRIDGELLEELDRRGLSVEDEPGRKGGWIGFALTLPLKRFATAEGLEDQEHIVLDFCQHALNTLLTSPR